MSWRWLFFGITGLVLLGGATLFATATVAGPPPPSGPFKVKTAEHLLKTEVGAIRIIEWAPLDIREPAPLVLYAPGWGGHARDGSLKLAELASHGYVTVAFDDVAATPPAPGESAADQATRGSAFSMESPVDYKRSFELASRRVHVAARQSKAVLDAILAAPEFAQRIDPRKIGFLGFSFGGAAGVEQSLTDQRLKAVVNFDGWLFGESAKSATKTPYLLFYINEDFPPKAWLQSKAPGERALAQGCRFDQQLHRPLMGQPQFTWLRATATDHERLANKPHDSSWNHLLSLPRTGARTPSAGGEAHDTVVRAFFDKYLKGAGDAFPPADGNYPGDLVTVRPDELL